MQELQQRLNALGDTAGTTAGELADDLQVQQSLNNIYSTLESTINLRIGETVRRIDLLYGLLVASANDAASVDVYKRQGPG